MNVLNPAPGDLGPSVEVENAYRERPKTKRNHAGIVGKGPGLANAQTTVHGALGAIGLHARVNRLLPLASVRPRLAEVMIVSSEPVAIVAVGEAVI